MRTKSAKFVLSLSLLPLLLGLLLLLSLPLATRAAACPPNAIRLSTQIPGMPKCEDANGAPITYVQDLPNYIFIIYSFALGTAGILATIMLTFGGFLWITAAGNPQRIGTAKEYISSALIGLVLIFGAYSLFNLINPRLLSLAVPKEFTQVQTTMTGKWCEDFLGKARIAYVGKCGDNSTLMPLLGKENETFSSKECIWQFCNLQYNTGWFEGATSTGTCVDINFLPKDDPDLGKANKGYVCKYK